MKDECISDKDYKRLIKVWNMFEIKLMGDYHDLYLKTDVLLLADVYGLDPCHCFYSLGLSWDEILKMIGVKLELISDIDMYQFVDEKV